MKYIDIATGRYPVSSAAIREAFPSTSFPEHLDEADLSSFGFAPVRLSPRPVFDPMTHAVYEGEPELADGIYSQTWVIRAKTPEELSAAQTELLASYTSALDAHIDATAKADRWDNRITCVMRAGYPNQWQAKGIAFGTWMDTCYALAYQIMADVQAGTRALPTIQEFISEMPVMEWPQ